MINFSSIDLSGSIVGLVYDGHRRYRSSLGGLFSIVMIMAIISISITYLKEFFGRNKPKMSFENMKYWNPPLQNLSNDFNFTVLMKYDGITKLRNDIIKINAYYISKHGTQSTSVNIPVIPCHNDIEDKKNLFQTFELAKGLCFNVTSYALTGTQVTDIFQYIQIVFELCIDREGCLPLDQMKYFFEINRPQAFIYFEDLIFQPNEKHQRTKAFYNYVDVNVTFGDLKETNIYFSKNQMLIDDSYFFPSYPKNYSSFMIDSFRDLVSVRTEQQSDSLTLNLLPSKNQYVIYISYMQLSELLASVSALTNITMIIFTSLGEIFNHQIFQNDLMQTLFNLDVESRTLDNIKKEMLHKNNKSMLYGDSSHNKCINITTKDYYGISRIRSQGKKQGQSIRNIINLVEKRNLYTKRNTIVLHYNYMNMLIFSNIIPFCHSKKLKEVKKKFNKINQFLLIYQDQKNIFRKMQEVDYLKYLLLTEEQLALYQIIPKPNYNVINELNTTDFSSLFCWIPFHYLKSHKEIERDGIKNEFKKVIIGDNTKEEKNEVQGKLILSIQKYE